MNRKVITIDECMSMSEKELNEFIDNDKRMLEEGLVDENQLNIDFQGMTIKDVAKKYGCVPMDDVLNNIRNKLGS